MPEVRTEGFALGVSARVTAGVLQGIAIANVLYLSFHMFEDMWTGEETAPAVLLALGLTLFSGLPAAILLVARGRLRASLERTDAALVVTTRALRQEIPIASIAAVLPLRLPLPLPGFKLRLGSGAIFPWALCAEDPGPLLEAIGEGHRRREPWALRAEARATQSRRPAVYWAIKYGVLPLALGIIVFRLNQIITYGDPFGGLALYGPARYFASFAVMTFGLLGELIVYATTWRILAELALFPLTRAWPRRALFLRRAGETVCELAYFVVIPAFVAFRIFA